MKTKPTTLILTLLFCLSGSVFAEEENVIRLNDFGKYILKLEKFIKLFDSISFDVYKEQNIDTSLSKLRQVESDMDWIRQLQYKVKDVKSALNLISISLEYEQIIGDEKINNSKLLKNHHRIRYLNFHNANKNIELNLRGFISMKGLIVHSTAKSTVGLLIDEIESVKRWLKINEEFKFKWENEN
jgi:hypothetical protein